MKIAMCNEMFVGWNLEKQFRFIAECGYDGVELAPFTVASDLSYANPPLDDVRKLDQKTRDSIVKVASSTGIGVSGLHWLLAKTTGFYLTSPEDQIRNKTAEYLRELAYFCRDIGGQYMVLGSPQQRNLLPNLSMESAYDYAADVLSKVLPTLEETKVVLGLEPLTPFETNFLQTGADARFLIEKLGKSKWLGVHLDCKAMFGSEKLPADAIIRDPSLRPYLKTFHANDPNLQGPGFGKLDFKPIMGALKEIGFDGWIGIEPFDYSPGVERLAKESIKTLKRAL
ncbi:MAG: sugar phosphate isomerase/epimerase family protein [Planctomycetia bacterium]|nr:sugar phosphate isomerase/epimerase family protein [Planctomycetia bacterium]